MRREVYPLDGALDDLAALLAPVNPVQPREVVDVVAHREVGVDARGLGRVADEVPQRRRTSGQPEHRDLAGRHDLHTDDGPQQGRLAASARPEQPDDLAGRHVEVDTVQDLATPAADHQPAHHDPLLVELLVELLTGRPVGDPTALVAPMAAHAPTLPLPGARWRRGGGTRARRPPR
ncbi:hypothetical protein GCM10025862_01940 [Arsenicicoccus piscis]|uniref:Uncharacterized protein n=1 Tax=Arsenicicoccus piscis TaxID=673954 RepID=A0ABQ6HKJ8_9MICO|nr:hypothetical protein GCM10025862_01940 [Arsenicicoccus piscis]